MKDPRFILSVFFLLIACSELLAQTYSSGNIYDGTNQFVTYHAGNLPLVISVPHGGLLDSNTIPDRLCANCVTGNDTNTRALGLSLKEAINRKTGCDVHLVVGTFLSSNQKKGLIKNE